MSEPLTELISVAGTREQQREKMRSKKMHIDEFLDMPSIALEEGLEYPHFLFTHWRKDALEKCLHEPYMRNFKLFVEYQDEDGNWKTYRVVGASRMGDVWLTADFNKDTYDLGCRFTLILNRFRNWRDIPDWKLDDAERMSLAREAGIKIPEGQITGADRRRLVQYIANWMRSNKVPERFLEASPEQQTKLLAARRKRNREE